MLHTNFHVTWTKEIVSWFLWCPRNAQRLWKVFVQQGEIQRCSNEPTLSFGCLAYACCWSLPSLLQPQENSRFLVKPCCFLSSPWSPKELSQHCCNPFGQLLLEHWCYLAPLSLWEGYLLEARAFCNAVRYDIIFIWAPEELRASCAFLRGTEESWMLPVHPMSWYHLPVWAEGKVTNVMLKKKFPFYY